MERRTMTTCRSLSSNRLRILLRAYSICLSWLSVESLSSASRRSILQRAALASLSTKTTSILPFAVDPSLAAPDISSKSPLVPGGVAKFNPTLEGDDLDDLTPLSTKLGRNRILASELSPLQPPALGGDTELYYAPFLFGAWNVSATLRRKIFPYGMEYLPSVSLKEGSPRYREEKVGNTTYYQVHYFSTLANTLSNQLVVNFGTGVPESRIIQDRAYNAISISSAYRQLARIQDVTWDYRDEPGKLLIDYQPGALAEDMRPLGPRRTQVFINARQVEKGEQAGDEKNGVPVATFCAAERSRSVTLAPGDVIVSDLETITEFVKQSDDHVSALSRIAVYLSPNPNSREGILWQQVGGRAVAFYDYAMDMRRLKEDFTLPDGAVVQRACVKTPKDVVQCY